MKKVVSELCSLAKRKYYLPVLVWACWPISSSSPVHSFNKSDLSDQGNPLMTTTRLCFNTVQLGGLTDLKGHLLSCECAPCTVHCYYNRTTNSAPSCPHRLNMVRSRTYLHFSGPKLHTYWTFSYRLSCDCPHLK